MFAHRDIHDSATAIAVKENSKNELVNIDTESE